MPSIRLVLITLIFTLITICGILSYMAQASVNFQHVKVFPVGTNAHSPRQITGGRWQVVRSSLGLEPLPAAIATPLPTTSPKAPSRIGFRRHKRSAPVSLHLAHDAFRAPRVSLKELIVIYRRIAHEDAKEDVARAERRKGRKRLGKNSMRKGLAPSH